MMSCRCGIPDWRALRQALGITQWEMARLAKVQLRAVQRWEQLHPHICPNEGSIEHLRRSLKLPRYRERLERAEFDYPFASDWK